MRRPRSGTSPRPRRSASAFSTAISRASTPWSSRSTTSSRPSMHAGRRPCPPGGGATASSLPSPRASTSSGRIGWLSGRSRRCWLAIRTEGIFAARTSFSASASSRSLHRPSSRRAMRRRQPLARSARPSAVPRSPGRAFVVAARQELESARDGRVGLADSATAALCHAGASCSRGSTVPDLRRRAGPSGSVCRSRDPLTGGLHRQSSVSSGISTRISVGTRLTSTAMAMPRRVSITR